MGRIFDSNVQVIKYKVLREVARHTWAEREIFSVFNDIANEVVKKDAQPNRCCIYKDRAIVAERIRIALGGNENNPNIVEVIDIACDECPVAGYTVTDLCRGCLAHACETVCNLGAIKFKKGGAAEIDKSKCVECGRCAEACPYAAIYNFKRPCEKACKVNAIHMAEGEEAEIDHEKCVSCGSCVHSCPFGAIADKSFITHVIKLIKQSENNSKFNVHAILAPAFASQFSYTTLGKVVSAIREVGFANVFEVASSADIVAHKEAKELEEKGFLTTSCCPAFVKFTEREFPAMAKHISSNLSPMGELGRLLKERDPECKVVFIGPCTAKKDEIKLDKLKDYIDYVLTFEEIQALIDSKDIDVNSLEETELDTATGYGRAFAKSGGVADAVKEALIEQGSNFPIDALACEGLDSARMALRRASKGLMAQNLIEGMACLGGCVGGAGCMTRADKHKRAIDKHAAQATRKQIKETVENIYLGE